MWKLVIPALAVALTGCGGGGGGGPAHERHRTPPDGGGGSPGASRKGPPLVRLPPAARPQ